MQTDSLPTRAPEGYELYPLHMGYSDLVGPIYRRVQDGVEWLGLHIEQRHANRAPMAHGGMIASLADIVIGRAAMVTHDERRGCLTINLEVDYLKSAPLGSWLEATASRERMGNSIGFVRCQMFADGELVAQARGILKLLQAAQSTGNAGQSSPLR